MSAKRGESVVAKLTVQQIRELAKQIILESPTGIRYGELVRRILQQHPETPRSTIQGSIWDLDTRFPNLIHKPSRGLFSALGKYESSPSTDKELTRLPREEDFYEPFADWLKNELDEVTVAVAVGGSGLQKKWGTPDVVGVYKPLASHRIKIWSRDSLGGN
ncbi:MAG: hypothetical protein RMI91_12070 [Gemmatales bacterium]|nr:hypothetical protein [Gemmatales bacterium]MDW7995377.1 hypothetical protein [Gemmatales bacterium]